MEPIPDPVKRIREALEFIAGDHSEHGSDAECVERCRVVASDALVYLATLDAAEAALGRVRALVEQWRAIPSRSGWTADGTMPYWVAANELEAALSEPEVK